MSGKPQKEQKRREISRPARILLRSSLAISCLALASALLLAVYAGPLTAHNVHIHRLVADLYRVPQGILLVAFLGALIVEDRLS